MSRLFVTSRIDARRLNQPAHQIARQTHGERRRIHGAIRPMAAAAPARGGDRVDLWLGVFGYALAAFLIGYFAGQLLRLDF